MSNQSFSQLQEQDNIDEQKGLSQINVNLPQSYEISEKHYDLKADMITGWKPNVELQGPIKLNFNDKLIKYLIDIFYHQRIKRLQLIQLVYLGFRPRHSYDLHDSFERKPNSNKGYHFKTLQQMREKFKYILQHMQNASIQQNQNKQNDRYFLGPNPKLQPGSFLVFDSYFESGNLDMALKVDKFAYDLYMRVDTNTQGHNQWFHFSIKGGIVGQRYKFQICNFTKYHSLYRRNMKPYVFSKKKYEKFGISWEQQSNFVTYDLRWTKYELEIQDFKIKSNDHKIYYALTFYYDFEEEDDEVFFAYCPPYTYTNLMDNIQLIQKNQQKSYQIMSQENLCKSLSGLDVPLLTITNYYNYSKHPLSSRKIVFLTARLHPGESNGSWMMQVFIQQILNLNKIFNQKFMYVEQGDRRANFLHQHQYIFLLLNITFTIFNYKQSNNATYAGQSPQSYQFNYEFYKQNMLKQIEFLKNIQINKKGFLDFITSSNYSATVLRNLIIFKIIPMMNPDGVIAGNYRTGFAGQDLNRQFIVGVKATLYPTVSYLIDFVKQTISKYSQSQILGFFDFHGHSIKDDVFSYGPDPDQHQQNYWECRIFPKIFAQLTPMFKFQSSLFQLNQSKITTLRASMLSLGLQNVFTIESSFGYYWHDRKTHRFNIDNYKAMGQFVGNFKMIIIIVENIFIGINDSLKIQITRHQKYIFLNKIFQGQGIFEYLNRNKDNLKDEIEQFEKQLAQQQEEEQRLRDEENKQNGQEECKTDQEQNYHSDSESQNEDMDNEFLESLEQNIIADQILVDNLVKSKSSFEIKINKNYKRKTNSISFFKNDDVQSQINHNILLKKDNLQNKYVKNNRINSMDQQKKNENENVSMQSNFQKVKQIVKQNKKQNNMIQSMVVEQGKKINNEFYQNITKTFYDQKSPSKTQNDFQQTDYLIKKQSFMEQQLSRQTSLQKLLEKQEFTTKQTEVQQSYKNFQIYQKLNKIRKFETIRQISNKIPIQLDSVNQSDQLCSNSIIQNFNQSSIQQDQNNQLKPDSSASIKKSIRSYTNSPKKLDNQNNQTQNWKINFSINMQLVDNKNEQKIDELQNKKVNQENINQQKVTKKQTKKIDLFSKDFFSNEYQQQLLQQQKQIKQYNTDEDQNRFQQTLQNLKPIQKLPNISPQKISKRSEILQEFNDMVFQNSKKNKSNNKI